MLAGQTVTFTVAAVGNQPLSYLWQRNGTNLSDGGNISGSATSSLTLHSASLADAGTYSVVVGNADGVAASSGAVLTVTAITAPGTTLTTLYSFTGGNDGGNPNGLLRVANGSFYGTTQNGGTNLAGTVFQMTRGRRGHGPLLVYRRERWRDSFCRVGAGPGWQFLRHHLPGRRL